MPLHLVEKFVIAMECRINGFDPLRLMNQQRSSGRGHLRPYSQCPLRRGQMRQQKSAEKYLRSLNRKGRLQNLVLEEP